MSPSRPPAVPVSAALLAPVEDDSGRTGDSVVRAGNHVPSAERLDAPDRQVGRRLLAAGPGAEAGGLLSALTDVLRTGQALRGHPVDSTEWRSGPLHRTTR